MAGNVTTSASDVITGALLNINAFAAGQAVPATISTTVMQVLNDLLDSLSTDQAYVYTQTQNLLAWTPGQYQYTIGNPTAANTFAGYTTNGSAIIVGITNPSAITVTFGLNAAGVNVGGTLTDTQAAIPAATTIVSLTAGSTFNITFTGAPSGTSGTLTGNWTHPTGLYLISFSDGENRSGTLTNGNTAVSWNTALTGTPTTAATVNTTQLVMSQNATQTLTTAENITYTIPGNFAIPRPLRIRNSFTRVTTSAASGLDYWFDMVSFERYNEVGLKTVPGPWPFMAAYQPTFPYGNLWIYPNPTISGNVFLYTDLKFSQFTSLTQSVSLPEGYNRSLKKLLALELCPMFGKTPSPQLILQAKEAKALLLDQNTSPTTMLRYDTDLVHGRHTDAGFIVHGGFL